MSELGSEVARSVSTEESNSRRSHASGTPGIRKNRLQPKKKKGSYPTRAVKIYRATSELNGYCIAAREEAPGKVEITHKNFKEVLERHALKTYSCPQDLSDFFEKGTKPKLKEPDEPKSTKKTAQAIQNI